MSNLLPPPPSADAGISQSPSRPSYHGASPEPRKRKQSAPRSQSRSVSHKVRHSDIDANVEKLINRGVDPNDPTQVLKDGKLSLFEACALNTLNMFGTGPFITVPFVVAVAAPPGPHAMWGYGLACVACVLDSLIWAELGSIWPKNGGTYVYLREMYDPQKFGRLMAFLFIWQFLVSGPMEVASGFIAMAQYMSYITGDTSYAHHSGIAFAFCVGSIFALYRNIKDIGKITIFLWAATIAAVIFTLVGGFAFLNLDHFATPAGTWDNPGATIWSLGLVARFGVYDFTGYFDINQVGDEVQDPKRNIPIACIFTCVYVCIIYVLVNVAIIGFLPWDPAQGGFVELVTSGSDSANFIMSIFAEKLLGRPFAIFFSLVVVVTIFGSCFAIMLGYSMIPSAASRDGYFFEWMGHENETHEGLADYALLFVGGFSLVFCFVPLGLVIEAMITTRVLVQFMAQSAGLWYYRNTHPETERVFTVPYYRTVCSLHLLIFFFIFITTDNWIVSGGTPLMEITLLYIGLGVVVYMIWAKKRSTWPFEVDPSTNYKLSVTAEPTAANDVVNSDECGDVSTSKEHDMLYN